MNLTKLAIKRPVSMIIIVFALLVFGAMSIATTPLEMTPDIEMPMFVVMTTYPGAGPEDVEELVSKKVEDACSTLNGLKNVQSVSQENVSLVILELEYGSNMDIAHMDLQEKINRYKGLLPDNASDPIIMEMDVNGMPSVVLSASATGDINLLNYINESIVPEFEKLSGVASVDVAGGQEEYISIQLMEDRLRQYGLDIDTISALLSAANFSIPAGDADMGTQSLAVRAAVEYKTVESLRDVPIPLRSGGVIHLSDVAQIFRTSRDADSISRYNGVDNISLSITKRQSASTLDVSRTVLREVGRLNAADSGVRLDVIYDSSDMIVDSVKTVFSTLILGVLLSMLVLFLFFGDIKASLIVGSSMPISLLVTVILMKLMGFSLNVVSLGGMVIGVGMMVDSSIVVIESCFRRSSTERQDFKKCAIEGAGFVAMSIIASTITTVVVFLPISVMKGLSGQLFKQLGFTIIFSLTASLICALTLVPLFFSMFKPVERREAPISRFVRKVEVGYGNLLRHILPFKKTVVLVSILLLVGSIALVPLIHVEMMPSVDEGTIAVSAELRPGLQVGRVDEIMTDIEQLAANHPDVERYSLSTGGGSMMMGSSGGATLTAYLKGDREMSTNEVVEQWRQETREMLDCEINVESSSSSMGSMAGGGDVEVNLQGNDYDLLKTTSAEIESLMHQNSGIVRVTSTVAKGNPQAKVEIDPLKAASKGFQPAQIGSLIYKVLSGSEVTTLSQNGQEYEIWVEYPRGRFQTISDLSGLILINAAGQQVPLLDVAEINFSDSPQSITRKNNQYIVTVTGQPTEAAKYTAKAEILAQVQAMQLPNGVTLASGSMDEQMMQEFSALGMAIAIAALLVFMVMAMQFESPKFSLMVMVCVPFSLIGSFGLLYLTNSTLSMPSLMGFLTLVGTVVNNGILFVDTTNQYRSSMDMQTALLNTGRTRLRPILMTTLTTVLSMVPMSLGIGDGAEMMRGMAVVIIGGLCASTLLTLLLLPTFYLIFEGRNKENLNNTLPPPAPVSAPAIEDTALFN